MKRILITIWSISLLLAPFVTNVYSDPDPGAAEAPPVAPTLVREGDFAVKLVETLKLGSASSEAEAESTLASAGIAPKNGWIASYPVTPDILSELRNAVWDAADAGRLAMGKDEAVHALQTLAAEGGLPVVSDASGRGTGKEPTKGYGQYSDPTVINNYYYNEGPPVVTYYPPPWDYYYMYSWVPSPFWWNSFFFSGFFVLHDFHRVIVVRANKVVVVTNHVFNPITRTVGVIDPPTRASGQTAQIRRAASPSRGFASAEAQRGAASIAGRSRERAGVSNVTAPVAGRGTAVSAPGSSGPAGRREGMALTNRGSGQGTSVSGSTGPLRGSGTDRRLEGGRIETGPGERTGGFINRPSDPGIRQGTNLNRFSEGGSAFTAPPRSDGRGFSSSSGGGSRSFSQSSVSSGRSGGMSFERPSPRVDRSFSAPSIRAPSASGGGPAQGFRGSGGSNGGHGGFARGGFSGGGCRGRC